MIRPRPAPAPPIDDAAFQALKAEVIDRTGHHYYADKDAQLWERVATCMEARGLAGIDDYLALLAADDAEWRRLESAITINETFFFRFAEQFDMLRRTLLPRLLAAAKAERRLRIWSVGCSTGAEPYSIAILLDDLLGAGLADWRISITGTDIDETALAAARAAIFSPWALRTLGEDERARLFERKGNAYHLKPHYRGLVRFEPHNMMALLDPAAPLGFSDYDLILCRNVLIYFRPDVATRLAGALAGRLAPCGYLLVGHAEAGPDVARVATPDEVAGILTYRRPDFAREADAPIEPPAPLPPAVRRPKPRPIRAHAITSAPPLVAAETLDDARAALASGDIATAIRLAQTGVDAAPDDPVPQYLLALAALALGDAAGAEQGFRRALYLDNRFAMAHYLLGRQLLAMGRKDDGRRALANAARAVAPLDADATLPEGDGMTAGTLTAAVRAALG